MRADALLADLEHRGVRLSVDGTDLIYQAPHGVLTGADRDALRLHKAAVLALLAERARALETIDWRRVSLHRLTEVLEVIVPWSDVPLVIAPGCRIARALRARAVRPGAVWCVCEVSDVLLSGLSSADLRAVAEAKLALDGTLVGVTLSARFDDGVGERS